MHLGDEHAFIYIYIYISTNSSIFGDLENQIAEKFPATEVYEAEVKELKVRTSVYQCSPLQKKWLRIRGKLSLLSDPRWQVG